MYVQETMQARVHLDFGLFDASLGSPLHALLQLLPGVFQHGAVQLAHILFISHGARYRRVEVLCRAAHKSGVSFQAQSQLQRLFCLCSGDNLFSMHPGVRRLTDRATDGAQMLGQVSAHIWGQVLDEASVAAPGWIVFRDLASRYMPVFSKTAAHLLPIVVPGLQGAVREDKVQDQGVWKDIQLGSPPLASFPQPMLTHLQCTRQPSYFVSCSCCLPRPTRPCILLHKMAHLHLPLNRIPRYRNTPDHIHTEGTPLEWGIATHLLLRQWLHGDILFFLFHPSIVADVHHHIPSMPAAQWPLRPFLWRQSQAKPGPCLPHASQKLQQQARSCGIMYHLNE